MSWYGDKGSPEAYDEHFDKWLPQTKRQTVNPWPFKLVIAKKARGLVLDAGCGPGVLNKYLANAVFLDFSKVCLIKRWTGMKRHRILASAENMPFKSEVFDTVIACELIEHVDNPHRFVVEVYRVLKNNGRFLFSFPWSDNSPTHKWKKISKPMIHKWISPPFKKYEWDIPPVRKERGMVYALKEVK